MNLTKTRKLSADLLILLKQVYEQNGASNLEKDLLKENLRELYKAIDETEMEETNISNGQHKEDTKESPKSEEPARIETIPTPIPEPIIEPKAETPQLVEQPISSSFTFLDEQPEEVEEKTEEEAIPLQQEEIKIESKQEVQAEKPKEQQQPLVQEVKLEPEPIKIPEPEPVQKQAEPAVSGYYMAPETEELFAYKIAKELSDKLSQSHLPDLHKAFGLNDRLLAISELFGGDQLAFRETMDTLNSYSHFDQAKRYLSEHVVDRFQWTKPAKKDAARQLIQLIRRKYI